MVVDSWFTLLMYIVFRFDRDHDNCSYVVQLTHFSGIGESCDESVSVSAKP